LTTYARELVAAISGLDRQNSYVVIRRPNTGPPFATAPHVREVFAPFDASTPTLGHGISSLGLDLYHSLHHFLPYGLRVPHVVVTLHDLIWLEHRELIRGGALAPATRWITHWYARCAIRHAVLRADRVIAISAHTRARAAACLGVDPSHIDVIHHGVAHERFQRAAGAATPAGPPYFLCIGNGKPYKNITTALRAFASITSLTDARLVVVGRGDSTRELVALARRLGVLDRVAFAGLVSPAEMVALLHGALALVFPSLIEGFGLPVLEAMAAGCPVIASTCEALAEVTGPAALLCDPYEPDAFAVEMLRVASDPGLRDELRARGTARARGFSWSRCATETLRVYDAVLGRATQSVAS
jgi:glycosyltransferase involved in cell wall biosynthesis